MQKRDRSQLERNHVALPQHHLNRDAVLVAVGQAVDCHRVFDPVPAGDGTLLVLDRFEVRLDVLLLLRLQHQGRGGGRWG